MSTSSMSWYQPDGTYGLYLRKRRLNLNLYHIDHLNRMTNFNTVTFM